MAPTASDLTGLFAPERVAVIGATAREGSIGRVLMENLLDGYEGELVAVNPNHGSVMGVPCVPTIGDAGVVDLAVVAIPAAAVPDVLRAVGEAGVDAAVVISAGFSEGGEEGAARERELARIAESYGIALVGPNSLGVLGTDVGLNATFAPATAQPGHLSFLSQSGAVVSAVLDWANDEGIGFEAVVSLGNKAVLDEVDLMEAWDGDPDTAVVLGYLESVTDGRAFIDRVRAVTRTTPVVLCKAGRTEAGAEAAASHTGAVAGSDAAVEAAFDQAGVIRTRSLEETFDVARALAGQQPPTGGVGIVSNAGGLAVLATDALGETTLELATFDEGTVASLGDQLPDEADPYNPIDVIGDADVDRFAAALETVIGDPGVGSVIVCSAPSALLDYGELARAIVDCQGGTEVPVVTCLMGGDRVAPAERALSAADIPNYRDPVRAVRGLEALDRYDAIRRRPDPDPTTFPVDRDRAEAVFSRARDRGVSTIGVEALDLLDAYGIPTAAGEVVSTPEEADAAARDLGEVVVLKVVSPDLPHKVDVGGVAVDVPADEASDRYRSLVDRVATARPDADIVGVLVQEQVDADPGVETLLGVTRDPQFGPLVAFGLGGIYVEVFADVALRVAPVDAAEARAMTESITAAPMLRGARGRTPVDLDAVVDAIQRVSQLATDHSAVRELDLNPLIATPDGVVAVDLRATIDHEAAA